tara:strand:+ start:23589 stop:24383 length:795 start_codon:yes stop_codon:yes gene_type:complete
MKISPIWIGSIILLTGLGGCASLPAAQTGSSTDELVQRDPLERINRPLYFVGSGVDRHAIRPITQTYVAIAPKPVRRGFQNFALNLSQPGVFLNDVFQGRLNAAGETLGRFAINSTVGLAGLFDIAKSNGLPAHDNDFGLTLGRAGVPAGAYLYIPVVGPSNVRDLAGELTDFFIDPLGWLTAPGVGAVLLTGDTVSLAEKRIDADAALQDAYTSAVDPYAAIKSYFVQDRQAELAGRNLENSTDLPVFPEMPGDIEAGLVPIQ